VSVRPRRSARGWGFATKAWAWAALGALVLAGCAPRATADGGGAFPPCRAADLNVAFAIVNAATGGELIGQVVAANRTDAPCVLRGMPALRLLGADGQPLGIRTVPCSGASTVDLFRCDPDAVVTLAPRRDRIVFHEFVAGQASLLLTWHIHDGAGFCPSPTPPVGPAVALRLTLPPSGDEVTVDVSRDAGGGRSEADFLGLAACDRGGLLFHWTFREVGGPAATPPRQATP